MGRTQMMTLVLVFVAGVAAYAFWYSRQYPREVVGHGSVRVASSKAAGGYATHATRKVSIKGSVFEEVALPNGTWIACKGDCAKAAFEAGDGFWEKQNDRR